MGQKLVSPKAKFDISITFVIAFVLFDKICLPVGVIGISILCLFSIMTVLNCCFIVSNLGMNIYDFFHLQYLRKDTHKKNFKKMVGPLRGGG